MEVGVGVEPEAPRGQVADEVAALGRGETVGGHAGPVEGELLGDGEDLEYFEFGGVLALEGVNTVLIWDMVYMVVLLFSSLSTKDTKGHEGSFVHEWALMFTNSDICQ